MTLDLTIVIPSYNTNKLLKDCLQSIKESVTKTKYEVVVIDNASFDGSSEMVKSKFPDIVLIKNSNNLGFAHAVNQGWRKGRGKFIIFLNSDTFVKRNSLDILVEYAKKHQEVGGLSGKLTLRDGRVDPDTHRGFPDPWSSFTFFLGLEKLFPRSRLFAQYHQGWKDKTKVHEIDAGAGALLLVPRHILEEIGGWDEEYFFYGEDIDLCYRLKQKGYKVVFHPGTDVVHYKGASSGLRRESKDVTKPARENLIRVTRGSINAWRIFYTKFYKDKYPFWVTWMVLFGIEIKSLLRLAVNRLKPL